MTIRKQLSIMMVLIIIASIAVNSFISTKYIDRYFRGYVSEQYDKNVEDVMMFSENLLKEGIQNRSSALSELNNFVDDPIVGIVILDAEGNEIASAQDAMFSMHRNMMMGRRFDVETDTYVLADGLSEIGQLQITRNNDVQSSETVRLFKMAMLTGTFISALVVFALSWILILISSKRLTKGITDTANYAKSIEMGGDPPAEKSGVVEIESLQMSLENLANRLKLQKAARKQKTDQLAHETRTPLTILKTHCEGALDGVIELDRTRLESCINEIENLSGLIENMNDVIEYDVEMKPLQRADYDLVSEVRKVMKGLGLQFRNKGLSLEYLGPEAFVVYEDANLLNQALYNLLTNAYKFTQNGGVEVLLSTGPDNAWTLSVKDTGLGIAPDEIQRIDEAYYRSPSAKETEGDGLGLYLTRKNIERLGGQLKIASVLGQGSEFSMIFGKNPQNHN